MAAPRASVRLAFESTRSYATLRKGSATKVKLPNSRRIPNPISRGPYNTTGRRDGVKPSIPAVVEPQSTESFQKPSQEPQKEPNSSRTLSEALQEADAEGANPLVAPINIPDDPNGILPRDHPALSILANSAILIKRQLEWGSILVGFEQANRYVIMDPHGETIGYLVEQDLGLGKAVARQAFRTHRSFTAHVFDREQKEVLRIHRPFSWVNSTIRVYDCVSPNPEANTEESNDIARLESSEGAAHVSQLPHSEMRIIGEASQEWAPLRRKYNLFLPRDSEQERDTPQLTSGQLPLSNSKALEIREDDKRQLNMSQFARVDEPFLSWDFTLKSADSEVIGSVNREFGNLGREIFADAGTYVLRMDSAQTISDKGESATQAPGMTLDQRAVMLATAVSVDFDYFSRKSGFGGLPIPFWIPMGGAEAGAAGAEAGAVGAAGAGGMVGATEEAGLAGASAGGLANAGRGAAGAWGSESTVAGVGTMAGYEAMHRGRGSQSNEPFDDASPQAPGDIDDRVPSPQASQHGSQPEDVWGESSHWDDKPGGQSPYSDGGSDSNSNSNSGSGSSEGGGLSDFFSDFFG
ncbi:Scramblase-domain-containing protein [Pseudovirgaria hyperparasitica]|uniref:Scramblase-domain-containing protein n=1 Tax=Pseudovirgaria hyperparasitica TaxID=470096 RepID=A0A6A6VZD5_9PEZI|nr:Scramblase-domain-containing protein [Pseudovirgaria hyperparasitica]KAF2754677.1 Scramblase-domain-containing protein [Pseudovirgaria hyperparasitica]